jgi:hypothetical protein
MPKQRALKPIDVVVALQLTVVPNQLFAPLALAIGISTSEAHASVQRLGAATLLNPGTRSVVFSRLWSFLQFGFACVYPAQFGPSAVGVPTGASAPVFRDSIDGAEPLVWPDTEGEAFGVAVDPLYPRAVELVKRNPALYDRLVILDALRAGTGRELERATELLTTLLGVAE